MKGGRRSVFPSDAAATKVASPPLLFRSLLQWDSLNMEGMGGREGGRGTFFLDAVVARGKKTGIGVGFAFWKLERDALNIRALLLKKEAEKWGNKIKAGKNQSKEALPFDQTECFAHKCLPR